MSADELWNAIKRIVESLLASAPQPRRGIVQSVDTVRMRVRVLVQPEGALTGFIPIASLMAGNGYGILAAPLPGDQVLVVPTDGFADSLVAVCGHWSTANQPPAGYNDGEIWHVTKAGPLVKLLNNGTVIVQDASGTTLTMNNDGTTTLTGDLRVIGEVYRGYGGPDQVSLGGHGHKQGVDSHGDTEADTDPPTAGT